MISDSSILETQSGTPSGVSVSCTQVTVTCESPADKKMHIKVPLDHKVAMHIQNMKAIHPDWTNLQCLVPCIPDDDSQMLFDLISDFVASFLVLRPGVEDRIQSVVFMLKALVNDKKISEAAGLDLINMLNGDDLE